MDLNYPVHNHQGQDHLSPSPTPTDYSIHNRGIIGNNEHSFDDHLSDEHGTTKDEPMEDSERETNTPPNTSNMHADAYSKDPVEHSVVSEVEDDTLEKSNSGTDLKTENNFDATPSVNPKNWNWSEDTSAYVPITPSSGLSISSLVRTIDPVLEVVYKCWICDDKEYEAKLQLICHLKEFHVEVPGIGAIEKRMRVSICMECGVKGSCQHRSGPDDDEEGEGLEDETVDNREGNSRTKSPKGSKKDNYPCTLCPKIFQTTGARSFHYSRDHPNEKAFQCIYCPEAFHTQHKLVVHTRTHTGYKPYVCGVCGNKFPKNSDLNRHTRIHTGEKPFQCAQCGKTFTQRSSLQKHAKRHADKTGGFPCYHCGLTFQEESLLDEHTKAEHGERTWKCKVCGKLFEERRHLFVHEKIHKEQETFACSYCGRLFTKRHQLLRHEDRIHRCKDELKCKICNKEFRRRENLNRHMNIHLDKREFQCTECGMAFTEKGSLKRHILSRHEQYRPFQCRICGKTFSRRFLVRKHHERVHKAFPFDCADVLNSTPGPDRLGLNMSLSGDGEDGNDDLADESVVSGGGVDVDVDVSDAVGDVVAAIFDEQEKAGPSYNPAEKREKVEAYAAGDSKTDRVDNYSIDRDRIANFATLNEGDRVDNYPVVDDRDRVSDYSLANERDRISNFSAVNERERVDPYSAVGERDRSDSFAVVGERERRLDPYSGINERERMDNYLINERDRISDYSLTAERERVSNFSAVNDRDRISNFNALNDRARIADFSALNDRERVANYAVNERDRVADFSGVSERERMGHYSMLNDRERLAHYSMMNERERMGHYSVIDDRERIAKYSMNEMRSRYAREVGAYGNEDAEVNVNKRPRYEEDPYEDYNSGRQLAMARQDIRWSNPQQQNPYVGRYGP